MKNETHSGDGLPRTPCSTSSNPGVNADLERLLNNLGGAWDALNEDPPFVWRAKRLLQYAGGCATHLLPEGHAVGRSEDFDTAVRDGRPLAYQSPQICPNCAPSTSSHSYPRYPMCNMLLRSNPGHIHVGPMPTGEETSQLCALSSRLSEPVVVGNLPFLSNDEHIHH